MENRYCPNCGQRITEQGAFCINCGYNFSQLNQVSNDISKVDVSNISENANMNNSNINNNMNMDNNNNVFNDVNNYNTNVNQQVASYTNGMAIAGFVVSIVSLCCCCYSSFLAIIGIILSIIGLSNANNNGGKGKGYAIAGIVTSGISIFLSIIFIVIMMFA